MDTRAASALVNRWIQAKVVSAQDVEDDGQGGARIAQGAAPVRGISVVDPDARHGRRPDRTATTVTSCT